MSILQIQKKHAKLYNIRLGKKEGKAMTRLVNEIRVTSPNKNVVDAFGEVYGGRTMRWDKEWQVFMPITRLPIVLLPGQNLTQWMELWGGGVCQRRCDGERMSNGQPCACGPIDLPIEDRECKPVTRLTVACPEVPVVGVGLLTTRSVIAAGEMGGALSIVQPVLNNGEAVRGILKVDQMVGPERRYAVPRIEFEGLSFQDIALAAGSTPALGAGDSTPALTEGGV